ncbi:hypothetical protein KM295_04290 [Natronomonas sp. F2-12]|jgi:hypothetical protein|uniref:Uncharacterized protein n=1 Tax=Natronomonas aquatica TaxID=2841590 RepID=A0A9R1CPP7_9EURY|nr:hypothetical protein [Natronomonas aquatica]MCQ4332723.1 hypothetical protein [Natronomonas aquatica]
MNEKMLGRAFSVWMLVAPIIGIVLIVSFSSLVLSVVGIVLIILGLIAIMPAMWFTVLKDPQR